MKFKKIITLVFTVLAVGMVVLSGIMKLSANPELVAKMSEIGIGPYIPVLGIMEITFAALFAWPKTMRIGFLLLSCYFAGALATELSHAMPFNALLPMGLVWISAFLRDKEVFLPAPAAV
ncbi:MAG TPA: DoxX family protein [Saprospiraceae bacterium]|nr:DoxX family protein [Saprospiraceae bacterium]HPI08964.1 DoxX family protein [Saprospiraceae bacterium]